MGAAFTDSHVDTSSENVSIEHSADNLSAILKKVLQSGLWAPSGDNIQPWSITIQGNDSFLLDLNAYEGNVFCLRPYPHLIAIGCFIENARIAANQEGYHLNWSVDDENIHVQLEKGADQENSDLYDVIPKRTVNRFSYKAKKVPDHVKKSPESSLDKTIKVAWFDSFGQRFDIAKLLSLGLDLRLRLPESYEIHHDMVDWSEGNSMDRLPHDALGLSSMTQLLTKQIFNSKKLNDVMFSLPGTTLTSQIEAEFIPALRCAGHFVLYFDFYTQASTQDYIRAGQSVQRFWLTMTQHDVSVHPWYLPFMFSKYVQDGIAFTGKTSLMKKAQKLHDRFTSNILAPHDIKLDQYVFSGRYGYPIKTNIPRSVRKDLSTFIKD